MNLLYITFINIVLGPKEELDVFVFNSHAVYCQLGSPDFLCELCFRSHKGAWLSCRMH